MQKHVLRTEKIRKIALFIVLLILSLITALVLLLQTPYIQTQIANYFTEKISEKLHTQVKINKVKIRLFRGFDFRGIYIEDKQKDTLLYVNKLSIVPVGLQTDFNNISLKEVKIDGLFFNLYEIGEDTLNLQFFIDAIQSDDTTDSKKDFNLKCNRLAINNSKFSLKVSDSIKSNQIDFENLKLNEINITLNQISIENNHISSDIERISAKDHCGFHLRNLISNKIDLTPTHIHLKELKILTKNSALMFDSLNLNYQNNYNFSDYKNKLNTNVSIKKTSFISYKDFKFFLKDTAENYEHISISGQINGCVNKFDLKNINLKYEDVIELNLDSKVENISSLKEASFFADVKNFNVDFQKFQTLKIPGKKAVFSGLPDYVKNIKSISYFGITKGNMSNFISQGNLSGNFGNINLTAVAKRDSFDNYSVKGNLSGTELNLAETFNSKDFGKMSFNQEVNLTIDKNKKIKLKTFGKVNELHFKKYLYKDIDLYAELNDKKIDSISIFINQKEIDAQINGNIDFFTEIPAVNIVAAVNYADLKALNFNNAKDDSFIKFRTKATFKGLTFEDFNGRVNFLSPLVYKRDSVLIKIQTIKIDGFYTENTEIKEKKILLRSDAIDINILTTNNASDTYASLKQLITQLNNQNITADVNTNSEIENKNYGILNIEADIKNPKYLTDLFFPDYKISENTKLYGFYDHEKETFNLSLNSKEFNYKKYTIEDFYLIAYNKNKKIFGGIGGSKVFASESLFLENVNLEGDFINDSINFNLDWNNFKDSSNFSANISGLIKLEKNSIQKTYFNCFLDKSEINVNDVLWSFNDANIKIDSSLISIDNLLFKHNNQKILIDGNISKYPGDFLFTEYKNLNLSNFKALLPNDFKIEGELNGSTILAQLYEDPLVFTKDSIMFLNINDINFGNFYLNSFWVTDENKIHANAYNLKGAKNQFMNDTIYGDYWPDKDSLNFVVDIRSILLKTFEEYYKEYTQFNPTAYLTGAIHITGKPSNPSFFGNIKLKQTTGLLKYLNTFYNISDMDVSFTNNEITIMPTQIISGNKNETGNLKGKITHNSFKNFKLDLDIDAQNLKLMNLNPTDSSYFYGIAYGTGNLNISGPFDDLKLDAEITTEKETYVFIPISTNETPEEEKHFIRFVSKDTSLNNISEGSNNYSVDIKGFSMNIKFNVTPDAQIQIITTGSGDIVTNGQGGLNLTLDKEGNFNMFGTYIIEKGIYKLDLDLFSTNFNVEKGSKIIWSGDPEDAIVDITAVHKIENVPLNSLIKTEETEPIVKSDVVCELNLTENLLDPKLDLDIDFSENVNTKYTNKLNSFDENEINQQFLSLLIQRKFLSQGGGTPGISEATPITGDLLTGQLNNILEKLVNDIDFNVIYEKGQENTTDEYGITVSGTAFGNWLAYKGGLGLGGNEISTNQENYVGEFELEAKLNRKGNIRAKVYNKANDGRENEGDYTQGLGFVLRKKFDSFVFWKRKEDFDSIKKKN